MSNKQAVLEAVGTLHDGVTWGEIADAMLSLAARRGTAADTARLYKSQLTAEDLGAYLNPTPEVTLDSIVAEMTTGDRP